MARGRKPQTNEQKEAKGETRPSRTHDNVIALPKVDSVPPPPEWLPEDGKALWNEIAPMLYAQKVLTKADLPALTHMCSMHASHLKLRQAGLGVNAAETNALRGYFAEFGMTPSSRTKVGTSGDKPGNGFANNGKRPARTD